MVYVKTKGLKKPYGFSIASYKKKVEKILELLGQKDYSLSILLTTDPEIRKINKEYLNRDRPTNVISFSLEESLDIPEKLLGEIIISVDTAKRETEITERKLSEQILYLTIHGLLHILGYDHIDPSSEKIMEEKTEELLEKLKG